MEYKAASSFSSEILSDLFNDAFSNYIHGPVHVTPAIMEKFQVREGIDPDLSRIFVQNGTPIGFGYIAVRGSACRLAGMGVITSKAEKGVGTSAMVHLIQEARERGSTSMELEAFKQNSRAIRLYSRAGFVVLRHLVGWDGESPASTGGVDGPSLDAGLETISIAEVAAVLTQHGSPDLPWQLTGPTIVHREAPDVAYRLGDAYVVISDPTAEVIKVHSFIVTRESRRRGQATKLVEAVFARHPEKKWTLLPIFPEDYGVELAVKSGFKKQDLVQVQMRLDLATLGEA